MKSENHLATLVSDHPPLPERGAATSMASAVGEGASSVLSSSFTEQVKNKMDRKTKPPGSLGRLEPMAMRVAALQQDLNPHLARKRICVYASSHGVAAEGVSAYPSEVTAQMVLNFLKGGAAINVLARHGGIDLKVIDVGVETIWPEDLLDVPNFYLRKVRAGTRNFLREAAMTGEECQAALAAGREQVHLAIKDQIDLLGIGEMGIGNTTSASALVVALLGLTPEEAVGRGTGVEEAVLLHKREVVRKAVQNHLQPGAKEPGLFWLTRVGGFEIAAMVGTILEAKLYRLPIVVDGFIATAAAVVAFALQSDSREVCFFSHQSDERAHGPILSALGVEPILDLGLRLGEGTGAALAMPILEAATKILCEMATFDSAGISDAIKAD